MLLRIKDKETLISIFSSLDWPLEVWAYGSRLTGGAHEASDLDLVIRTPDLQKLPFDVLADIKERIREITIPILVEVFDWARLPASFHRRIEAQHEVLFSSLRKTTQAANS
jgi:predicted nucleotidyltransferase